MADIPGEKSTHPKLITYLRVSIDRFVCDHNPNLVECRLIDRFGHQWLFHEKVPVVFDDYLDANSAYPQLGVIGCRVLSSSVDEAGRPILDVSTEEPWHIESIDEQNVFSVYADQVVEIPWGDPWSAHLN